MSKPFVVLVLLASVAIAGYTQTNWAERLSITHYAESYIDVSLDLTDDVVETTIIFDEADSFEFSPRTFDMGREVGVRVPIDHVDEYFIAWLIELDSGGFVSIEYRIGREDLGRWNFVPVELLRDEFGNAYVMSAVDESSEPEPEEQPVRAGVNRVSPVQYPVSEQRHYDIPQSTSYTAEISVDVEGIEGDDVSLYAYLNEPWTNSKNESGVSVALVSNSDQTLPAVFRVAVTEEAESARIGINFMDDTNRSGTFEWGIDHELGSILFDIPNHEGTELIARFETIGLPVEIRGDLDEFVSPVLLVNPNGSGTSIPRVFMPAESGSVELLVRIGNDWEMANSMLIFDDLNGDGDIDNGEPRISDEVHFDVLRPRDSYVLTLLDKAPVVISPVIDFNTMDSTRTSIAWLDQYDISFTDFAFIEMAGDHLRLMIPTDGASYVGENHWSWLFEQAIPSWSFHESSDHRQNQDIEWLRELSTVVSFLRDEMGFQIQNIELFEDVLLKYTIYGDSALAGPVETNVTDQLPSTPVVDRTQDGPRVVVPFVRFGDTFGGVRFVQVVGQRNGSHIVIDVMYDSEIEAGMSLFNPPNGSIVSIQNHDVHVGDGVVTFVIAADTLSEAEHIVIKPMGDGEGNNAIQLGTDSSAWERLFQ